MARARAGARATVRKLELELGIRLGRASSTGMRTRARASSWSINQVNKVVAGGWGASTSSCSSAMLWVTIGGSPCRF